MRAVGGFCAKCGPLFGKPRDQIIGAALAEYRRANPWWSPGVRLPLKSPAAELAEHEAMYFDVPA
jgi:hypothetical protein